MRFNWFSLLLLSIIFACSTPREEVVEEYFPDGSKKRVAFFEGEGEDRMKVEQIGYYQEGQLEIQGRFNENSNREGVWKYWYRDSTPWSECEYNDGLKEGKSVVYYRNGQKRYEGQYVQDQKTGNWKFWDENGALVKDTIIL